MIQKVSSYFNRVTSWWGILLCLILFIFVVSYVFPTFSRILSIPEGAEKIDTQTYYSSEKLYQVISKLDKTARRGYAISHMTADIIFPVVYTFLFGMMISITFRMIFPEGSWFKYLNLMPVGLFVFDIIENTLLSVLLLSYPERYEFLAFTAGVVTFIKWIFSGLTVILAVGGILIWVFLKVKRFINR